MYLSIEHQKVVENFSANQMDFVKFSFSRTSPTPDGTSTNYIYQLSHGERGWEIAKRFSEFETLLENV